MKRILSIVAIAALANLFSPAVKAQIANTAATKSNAAANQPSKGTAGKKRMMTTCTPRQKMSGAPCT